MLLMHATQENNGFHDWDSQDPKIESLKSSFFKTPEPSDLLQGVIENLIDGILIVTEKKELIYTNESARRILCKLNQGREHTNIVPKEIWHICQSLIESRSLFPNQSWTLESKIFTDDSTALNIQVQWLNIEMSKIPCLLITLEDRCQMIKNIAVEEAQSYKLTRREKEVWLLHRERHTYKQIASELCITPNTVKKHMKSIHVKQKEMFKSHA